MMIISIYIKINNKNNANTVPGRASGVAYDDWYVPAQLGKADSLSTKSAAAASQRASQPASDMA